MEQAQESAMQEDVAKEVAVMLESKDEIAIDFDLEISRTSSVDFVLEL